ncbi:hypothetical protein [Cupriavidus taiwanensis]|nr:hypothetical protein [Cupriavidus taiwanensis]
MATVLRVSWAGFRVRCRYWLRQLEALALALLLSLVLSVPTVRAQTLSSDGSLNWGITTTGPSTSSVNGTALVITAAALTLGFVATGGATAAISLTGRALSVAGSTVGPIAAAMLRQAVAKGPLTGAMLALAVAMGSDSTYDAASNSFLSAPAADAGQGYRWYESATLGTYFNGPEAVCQSKHVKYHAVNPQGSPPTYYYCYWDPSGGTNYNTATGFAARRDSQCQTGFTMQGSLCVSGSRVPSSDAQLGAALQAPTALAKVWDAGGCGPKITTYRDTATADDPCAKIINAPGGTWTPVSVPNGGSVSLPGKTETTTDAAGNVTGTRTTVSTAQVAPNTNQATMAASPVIVTPGQVVTNTTKNADGSTTTTTTATTNPAQTKEQPQDGSATFNAGDATLYDKKSRTWSQVLTDFQTAIRNAPWYQSSTGFFNVTISGGQCPHWTMAANKWMPALDAGQFVCSSTMVALYQLGGVVVMIVAAWAAFRIAFL